MQFPIKTALADHVIDRQEAKDLVRAYPHAAALTAALATELQLAPDDAARLSLNIQHLAKSLAVADFVDVGDGRSPRFEHETVAAISSPDLGQDISDATIDKDVALRTWTDLPGVLAGLKADLDTKRQTDPQAHLTLIVNTHGNNGTGFKLISRTETPQADGSTACVEDEAVASAAYINEQLAAAGLSADDVTVVSEACNGAHSYVSTVRGFTEKGSDQARVEAHALALESAWKYETTTVDGKTVKTLQPGRSEADSYVQREPTLFDAKAGQPNFRYTWVGWTTGVNASVAFLYYAAGVKSAPLTRPDHATAVVGHTKFGVYNQLPSAIVSEGEIVSTDEQHAAMTRVFQQHGGQRFYQTAQALPPGTALTSPTAQPVPVPPPDTTVPGAPIDD